MHSLTAPSNNVIKYSHERETKRPAEHQRVSYLRWIWWFGKKAVCFLLFVNWRLPEMFLGFIIFLAGNTANFVRLRCLTSLTKLIDWTDVCCSITVCRSWISSIRYQSCMPLRTHYSPSLCISSVSFILPSVPFRSLLLSPLDSVPFLSLF